MKRGTAHIDCALMKNAFQNHTFCSVKNSRESQTGSPFKVTFPFVPYYFYTLRNRNPLISQRIAVLILLIWL